MSNEELAAAIQAGAVEYMGELYRQVDGLVKRKASRVMTALGGRGGVEFDDLYQSGYLALVEAVGSYKPDRGAFFTWFMFHLKNAFADVTGYRTKSGRNDPLNHAASLDESIDDDPDGATMLEFVSDPQSTATMEAVEEREYQQQLHEALEEAMTALPERSAEVLRMRYYHGASLADVGKRYEITLERVRQIEKRQSGSSAPRKLPTDFGHSMILTFTAVPAWAHSSAAA